jgi:hypothetical protein
MSSPPTLPSATSPLWQVFRAGAASKLEKLRLSGNKIQLVSDDCVGALAMLLGSAESRLKTLILGTNPLRDEGALKLADIVQASRGLERLDVSACSITSKGLCSLARAIGAEPEGQRGSGFIEWHRASLPHAPPVPLGCPPARSLPHAPPRRWAALLRCLLDRCSPRETTDRASRLRSHHLAD